MAVYFRDVTDTLAAANGAPNGFELCDGDTCRWAAARLAGTQVLLDDPRPATKVRYCWGDSPVCTLTDGSALPAGPFELAIR